MANRRTRIGYWQTREHEIIRMSALDEKLLKEFKEENPAFDFDYLAEELVEIAIVN